MWYKISENKNSPVSEDQINEIQEYVLENIDLRFHQRVLEDMANTDYLKDIIDPTTGELLPDAGRRLLSKVLTRLHSTFDEFFAKPKGYGDEFISPLK